MLDWDVQIDESLVYVVSPGLSLFCRHGLVLSSAVWGLEGGLCAKILLDNMTL